MIADLNAMCANFSAYIGHIWPMYDLHMERISSIYGHMVWTLDMMNMWSFFIKTFCVCHKGRSVGGVG